MVDRYRVRSGQTQNLPPPPAENINLSTENRASNRTSVRIHEWNNQTVKQQSSSIPASPSCCYGKQHTGVTPKANAYYQTICRVTSSTENFTYYAHQVCRYRWYLNTKRRHEWWRVTLETPQYAPNSQRKFWEPQGLRQRKILLLDTCSKRTMNGNSKQNFAHLTAISMQSHPH